MCVVLGEGEAEPPPGFLLIAPLPCDASKHSQSMCGSMGIRGAKLSPVPLLYCPLNSLHICSLLISELGWEKKMGWRRYPMLIQITCFNLFWGTAQFEEDPTSTLVRLL